MSLVGLGILASMLWQMSQFNLNVSGDAIMWNGLIQGVGMGLVFLPLTTVTFSTWQRTSAPRAHRCSR